MKINIQSLIMRIVSCAAMISAIFIANTVCPAFSYQEEEPEAVRKLRKF